MDAVDVLLVVVWSANFVMASIIVYLYAKKRMFPGNFWLGLIGIPISLAMAVHYLGYW